MWGYESFSDLLAQDQDDIDSFINGAYFDCFAPAEGMRAMWPETRHSGILKAAVAATLTLTHGSKEVAGYAFEDAYAGSFIKIGEKFFRYAGKTGAGPYTYFLVEPWDGETGSYGATIYHNAIALPFNIIEMAGQPNLIGVGLLAPLPDPDAELRLRTEPAYDFQPRDGRQVFATQRMAFRQSAYFDTGDPRYYHIDQSSVAPTFTIGNRFVVYPIPEARDYVFEFRANVAPAALTADDDVPQMPAQTVDNILLPIARERLAENSAGRRYTGPNITLLTRAADRARSQLQSLRRVQRDVATSVRLRSGW